MTALMDLLNKVGSLESSTEDRALDELVEAVSKVDLSVVHRVGVSSRA